MTMEAQISEMKKIYGVVIGYIEDRCDSLMDYPSLIKFFDKKKIGDNRHLLKTLLHILAKISNNHHYVPNFFSKIEEIIKHFKNQIKKYFPNWEVFNIFKSNKRVLLFLFDEQIIFMDKYIVSRIIEGKYAKMGYPEYFSPEIKPFIKEKIFKNHESLIDKISKDLPKDFYEKRKIGENDNILCEIIRNDSVDKFSSYVKENKISLKNKIEDSIFETNLFLLKNSETLIIEYAVFYKSTKIFNFLREKGIELMASLWLYAIHGQNTKIIHLLDENNIKPKDETYKECFKESLKCHHNDIAKYFLYNFFDNENDNESLQYLINIYLKYFNFDFIQNDLIDRSSFNEICKYDYYLLADIILRIRYIINQTIK